MHSPSPTNSSADLHAPQERARIIAMAQAMYFQQGIAATAPAEIAGNLTLPEATVLHWFPTKEPLVYAVVDAQASYMQEELRRQKEASSTAVEELLALRTWMTQELNGNRNSTFFQQMMADYPAAWQRWESHMAGFTLDHLRHNLRWGMLQELYQENLDVDFLARFCYQQMSSLAMSPASGLEPAEVQYTLLAHFISGIVTPAGAFVARRLQETPPFY